MIRLNNLNVYIIALEIGQKIWLIVSRWDYFNKDTLGKQLIRAADSIALNIAEGYGRFHYKENKNFNYYSRGSAYETAVCIKKANDRNLLTREEYDELTALFEKYFKLINGYIKSIGNSKVEGSDH